MNREHKLAQAVLRSWPFKRGVGTVIRKVFKNPVFEEDVATVKTSEGLDLIVFTNDLIGRHIYLTGGYEESTINILCRYARPGDTLLDIGANIGYISASFLHMVPRSRVICVEPQPNVLELLKLNLGRFSEDRYKILPFAMSDKDGSAGFSVDPNNKGDGRLSDHGEFDVQIRNSQSLFLEGHLGKPDLIKIDVQGHEETVLRSLSEAIKSWKPRAILFEEEGDKSAPDQATGLLLAGLGYKVFGVRKQLFRVSLSPLQSTGDCRFNDYLAIPT